MKNYESVVVLKPDLEEAQVEESLGKIETAIEKQGGKITNLEKWGLRELAYEIQKYKQGNYVLLHFECEPKGISPIERHYKLADPIIRFVTLSIRPGQPQKSDEADSSPEEE